MKVAKWGNSLAIRLPSNLVDSHGLKEGDDIDVRWGVEGKALVVHRKLTKEELRERVKALRGRMPKGFKFDREEANER